MSAADSYHALADNISFGGGRVFWLRGMLAATAGSNSAPAGGENVTVVVVMSAGSDGARPPTERRVVVRS